MIGIKYLLLGVAFEGFRVFRSGSTHNFLSFRLCRFLPKITRTLFLLICLSHHCCGNEKSPLGSEKEIGGQTRSDVVNLSTEQLQILREGMDAFEGVLFNHRRIPSAVDDSISALSSLAKVLDGETKANLTTFIEHFILIASLDIKDNLYDTKLVDSVHSYAQLIEVVAKKSVADYESQIDTSSRLYFLEEKCSRRSLVCEKCELRGITLARNAVEEIPNIGRIYGNLASLLLLRDGLNIEVIDLYRKCAELDSEARYCKTSFESLRIKYESPCCHGQDIKQGLQFILARTEKEISFSRKVIFDNKEIYSSSTPVLVADNFVRVVQQKDRIVFHLDDDAKSAWDKVTEKAAEWYNSNPLWVLVYLDEKAVHSAVIPEHQNTNRLVIAKPLLGLEYFCDRISSNKYSPLRRTRSL